MCARAKKLRFDTDVVSGAPVSDSHRTAAASEPFRDDFLAEAHRVRVAAERDDVPEQVGPYTYRFSSEFGSVQFLRRRIVVDSLSSSSANDEQDGEAVVFDSAQETHEIDTSSIAVRVLLHCLSSLLFSANDRREQISPDHRLIAYIGRYQRESQRVPQTVLIVRSIDDESVRFTLDEPAQLQFAVSWSADAKHLLFTGQCNLMRARSTDCAAP